MKEVKDILVVRKHNQIGDMLCSLPLYAALKKRYPSAAITLVASSTNYPIPFNEINPYLDEVIIYDKTSLFTIIRFYFRLRKKRYDIGVVPSTIKLSRSSHIINFLSGAKIRAGVNSIDDVINKSASLLNLKKDFFWDRDKVNQAERNYDIAKLLGCRLTEEEKDIKLIVKDEHKSFAKAFIKENFPSYNKSNGELLIGIHPGAGKTANTWHYSNFVNLLQKIKEKYNLHVLITCGEIDKIVVENITGELKANDIDFSLAQNLHLLQLASVIEKLDLYITNDTGTMHIAAQTKVNQISLFGPTKAYEWGPAGNNKINLESLTEDISDISLELVISAIRKFGFSF